MLPAPSDGVLCWYCHRRRSYRIPLIFTRFPRFHLLITSSLNAGHSSDRARTDGQSNRRMRERIQSSISTRRVRAPSSGPPPLHSISLNCPGSLITESDGLIGKDSSHTDYRPNTAYDRLALNAYY